jgi:protein CpxP
MRIEKMTIKPICKFITVILVSSFMFTPSIQAKESETIKTHINEGEKAERKHRTKSHFKKMAKYLQLTEDQRSSIKVIFKELKDEKLARKESMTGFRQQIKSLMGSAVFDEQVFTELHSQYQTQFAEVALLKAKSRHAIMQVLTTAQQEKFATFKKGKKGRML